MRIRHRMLGIALAVAASVTLLGTGLSVWAQIYDQAPSGGGQVSISTSTGSGSSSTIDNNQKPTVRTDTPTISGTLPRGATEVQLAVMRLPGGTVIRWTASVDPATGTFSTTVPQKLTAGEYVLYVNGALVGRFVVAP